VGPEIDATPRHPDDCRFLCETPINDFLFGSHVEEGFRYSLRNVTHSDVRLRFDIDSREIFDAWCRAQTPIADEVNPGSYRCLRNASGMTGPDGCWLTPDGEPPIAIPCCKSRLCGDSICDCTADGCTANPQPMTFDLFIEGDVASGTTPFGTAHVERQ
jgi:hypothetical protein